MSKIDKKPKKYHKENLEFLCSQRGIDKETVRKELGMSKFQFSDLRWPNASEAVSNYFGITREQFLYSNLAEPVIKDDEGRRQFCDLLLHDIRQNYDEWEHTDSDLVKELYGSDVYKQISLRRRINDYNVVIVINLEHEVESDEVHKILPKGSFAYGYVDFGKGYNRYYKSFEHDYFDKLCDELLFLKNLQPEKWETKDFFKQNLGTKVSIKGTDLSKIPIIKNMSQSDKEDPAYIGILELFNEIISKLENGEVYEAAVRVQIMKNGRDYNQKILEQEHEQLQKKIERLEHIETTVLSELRQARKQLGNWNEINDREFVKRINALAFLDFCDELKLLSPLDTESIRTVLPEIDDRKIGVLKLFLWAKYIISYKKAELPDVLYDFPVMVNECEPDKVEMLLLFIKRWSHHEPISEFPQLAFCYVVMILILYGSNRRTIKEIERIRNSIGESNNAINQLYRECLVFYGLIENESQSLVEDRFTPDMVLENSNAQWTLFFEDSDGGIIERALPYVCDEINSFFEQNGMQLKDFFIGRFLKTKYHPFSELENYKLPQFTQMIKPPVIGKKILYGGRIYSYTQEGIFVEGRCSEIELLNQNRMIYSYPLIDNYLATYICKYMESRLRIVSKYKTKVTYKYGGQYVFDVFFNNPYVLKKIVEDYRKLKKMIDSGQLQDVIYKSIDNYLEQNTEEYNYWVNRFK